jgi:2-iminobutanoate/2-iminopropanoate deaminase
LKIIRTKKAKGSRLYSEGILSGNFVFTGGKVGMDPKSGEVRKGITEQTKQALENVKEVLEAAGTSMRKVVRVMVFLTDMSDYDQMNEVYEKFFGDNPPARFCVGVSKLAHPDLRVEIDAIAEAA